MATTYVLGTTDSNPTGSGATTCALSIRSVALSATAAAQGNAVVSLALRNTQLSARAPASGSAAVSLAIKQAISAGSQAIGVVNVTLKGSQALIIRARGIGGVSRAALSMDSVGSTVRDVVRSVLSLLGVGCCDGTTDDACLQNDLMHQINACLQTIYSRADHLGYFSRETVTLTFTIGLESKAFDIAIQGVIGPVRLETGRIPLREVTDRAQFERFTETFYGSNVPTEPRAYHLRSAHRDGGDNVELTLFVTPAPAGTLNILADVIREAPRYVWSDAISGTPLLLPHKYAESLLIPLVREWATSHSYFSESELLPAIRQQAETARQTLGLINPKKEKGPREAAATP